MGQLLFLSQTAIFGKCTKKVFTSSPTNIIFGCLIGYASLVIQIGNFDPLLKPFKPTTGGILKFFKKLNKTSRKSESSPVRQILRLRNVSSLGTLTVILGNFLHFNAVSGGKIKIFSKGEDLF